MARENHVLNNGLTDMSVKAASQGNPITQDVFKRVSINHLEGTYRSYGIDDFRPDDDGPTDLDAPYQRVEYNVGRKRYQVFDYGFFFNITRVELKTADSELRLQMRRQRNLMRRLKLNRELRSSKLIYNEDTYPDGHKIAVAGSQKMERPRIRHAAGRRNSQDGCPQRLWHEGQRHDHRRRPRQRSTL